MIHSLNSLCRSIVGLFVVLVLSLVFLPGADVTAAPNRIVKVGLYENAPKIFTDPFGKAAGIFADLIESIARDEDWEIQYVPGTWGEGLDRLQRGEIDLMPDVAHSAERETIFSFPSVPVLSSWYQIYARKGSKIQSILDLAGKRIVVLERSVQQDSFSRLAEGFGLHVTLVPLPDYQASFEMVARGEADAAITNRFYGMMHVKQYGLEDTSVIFEPSNLFFAAPKDRNQTLLAAIDARLTSMKQDPDSVYYRSLKRWTSEPVQFALPAWVWISALVAGVALLLSGAGSLILKAKVNERTRELRELNQTLHQSEQKYRELVTLANSIIIRFSIDGKITFINEFGLDFFGYSESEILGKSLLETILPETESSGRYLGSLMADILADPVKFEHHINENVRRNGERVWIDWRNKMLFDDQGQLIEILSIGSDITDRVLADRRILMLNEALRQNAEVLEQRVAERTAELLVAKERAESADRLKSAFLATMSHELRTPLNSIIGFTGILLQGLAGPLNEEQKKQMSMVQASSRHLLALINDVLDISKIEAGQFSLARASFNLRDAIEKTLKLVAPLAEKKGIDLGLEIDRHVGDIVTDQRRLEQVFLNLLNNAVKFTEAGSIRVSCHAIGNEYRFSVSDTGIGIRPEELPGLFQPFHQIDTGLSRKHEGTGLGLSICKKLVEMMGGSIQVQSQWGQGSTFTVQIPKLPPEAQEERIIA